MALPLVFVDPLHVLSPVRALAKTFLTELTRKGPLSGMDSEVGLERARLIERLVATRALPRLLLCMNANMPFQRAFLCEFP